MSISFAYIHCSTQQTASSLLALSGQNKNRYAANLFCPNIIYLSYYYILYQTNNQSWAFLYFLIFSIIKNDFFAFLSS